MVSFITAFEKNTSTTPPPPPPKKKSVFLSLGQVDHKSYVIE